MLSQAVAFNAAAALPEHGSATLVASLSVASTSKDTPPLSNADALNHDAASHMALARSTPPVSMTLQEHAPWRCCSTCGETFRTLGAKNAHATQCEGPAQEARLRQCTSLSADVMDRWRDAPAQADDQKVRSDVPPNVLFTEWPTIDAWLYSPAGYASVGGSRQMKSPRTASILKEDVAFCLSHMDSPALGGFCDPSIVHAVMNRIVKTYRSPTRMYNLVGCMQKVSHCHGISAVCCI
jgi:hypothetical protein